LGRKITEKKINLAPREVEVCNLIKRGLSNKDIADVLNVSLRTVETHRKKDQEKN